MFDRAAYEKRVQWYRDARFGMFIHWGLYSIPARGEWVRSVEKISVEDYQPFFEEFNPVDYAPKAWAKLAQYPGLFDGERLRRARTLHEFDDLFTAPLHGFRGVEDYWSRASAKPHLGAVRVPASRSPEGQCENFDGMQWLPVQTGAYSLNVSLVERDFL